MLVKLAISGSAAHAAKAGTSFWRNLKRNPGRIIGDGVSGGIAGFIPGSFVGAVSGGLYNANQKDKKKKVSVVKSALIGGGIGAALLGGIAVAGGNSLVGARAQHEAERRARNQQFARDLGRARQQSREQYDRWKQNFDDSFNRRKQDWDDYFKEHTSAPKPPKSDNPFLIKGFKTKKDAKAHYRDLARTHHPDNGGSEEEFKKMQNHWSDFQSHFEKLAFIRKRAAQVDDPQVNGRIYS